MKQRQESKLISSLKMLDGDFLIPIKVKQPLFH